jgi:hypothetical protein
MYDMFSATDSIDEARLEMFPRKQVIWLAPTPQRKQLSFNILIISVLHTNQYAYGDKKLLYEQEYGIWTVSDNDRKLIKLDISLIYVVILWPNGWLVC